jgi:hypothetical protein
MNPLKLFDFSEKKSKKYLAILFYCLVGLAILYFFLKKRSPSVPARVPQEKHQKEDRRPRLSVSGSLISPETTSTLSKLGRFTRLSLIFKVCSNDEEAKIREMLSSVQHLSPHHILFCETDIGYKALIRQLSPKLHIEESLSLASEMSSYVNAIAMVSDKECEYFYQLLEFQDCQSKVIRILGDLR